MSVPSSDDSSPETVVFMSEASFSSSGGLGSSSAVVSSTPTRLGYIWKSSVWGYFSIAEDYKFAECGDCGGMVSRGGSNRRNFNITNLVNHLKSHHPSIYRDYCESKNRRDREREASRKGRLEGTGGFTRLRQLSLQGTSQAVHKRLGEMIALDFQPISIVEDVGFKRLVNILEPRYNLSSRKYVTETVLHKIYTGIKEELFKLVHAPDVEYYSFTTDVWSTNVASHSLLSLTGHWIDENFFKDLCCTCCRGITGLSHWKSYL